ncbi:GNAT family N-acetyltransferase [Mesorhizobium sp. WSM3860]|uniref:GNAT family N-acetyltransferase n=1 Tax=Mesorhizobium sp. WSM3860 TaxID=2029403 RepID=UPI001FDF0224|nr:GNAT family N-acetyltransferase [Mesorhizobium sp. WSM3860]
MAEVAVDVRWATAEDAEALATVLCAMAAHIDHARATATARQWLGEESPAYPHFALAFAGGEVAGLASVAIAHPGIDLERLMFLKDLFVREEARNAGVGEALIGFSPAIASTSASAASISPPRTGTRVRCASTSGSAPNARARRFSSGCRARH